MNDLKRILVVVLGLITLIVCAFGIKEHIESAGYKKQVRYTTAIQVDDAEHFNYAVDTQQGNLLAHGTFSTKKEDLVKFPEMTKSFTYVERTREHYTRHTREVCSGSGENESCHTETYYTWDEVETEEQAAKKVSLYGREYDGGKFNYGAFLSSQSCQGMTNPNTEHGWFSEKHGCEDDEFYLDNNDRYVYRTVPQTFTGSFLASSMGGGLNPVGERAITIEDKSIKQILHDVGQYKLVAFWFVFIVIIILTIVAAIGAYQWVMADGVWSLDD